MTLGFLQEEELDRAHSLVEDVRKQTYYTQVKDFLQKKYDRNVKLVNSGCDALYRVFLHIKSKVKRRTVLMPAYTCYAPVKAAVTSGLRVVLVDVTSNFGMDIDLCEKAENVGAIVVVHPYGIPLDIKRFQEIAEIKSAVLIEDFAQSYGAMIDNCQVGVFGDYSILSFRFGKHISGIVGGAILSKEEDIPTSKRKMKSAYLESQIETIKRMLAKKNYEVRSKSEEQESDILRIPESLHKKGKKIAKASKMIIKAYVHRPNWEQGIMGNSQAYLTYTQLTKGKKIVSERNRIAQEIVGFCEKIGISKPEAELNSHPSFISVPILCKKRSKLEKILQRKGIYYEKKYDYSNIRLFPFLKRIGGDNAIRISREVVTISTDPFHAITGNYDQLEEALSAV